MVRINLHEAEYHREHLMSKVFLGSRMSELYYAHAYIARKQFIDGTVYALASVVHNSRQAELYASRAISARLELLQLNACERSEPVRYEVDVAEYAGNASFDDPQPIIFDTKGSAEDYIMTHSIVSQTGVRSSKICGLFAVYEVDATDGE